MAGPPVHVHPNAEETFEVLEGAIEVFMPGKWNPVAPRGNGLVPIGVPHSVRNTREEPVLAVKPQRQIFQALTVVGRAFGRKV